MIQAPFLHIGSHICILSPSGVVNPDFVWNAKDVLESWGLIVTIGKSVCCEWSFCRYRRRTHR